MGNYMGLYLCRRKKEIRVLIQGLDAAGKTTILYRLKLGEVVTTIPTIGFNVETIEHNNVTVTAWDVGGRDKIRPLYRHYYPNTQALIFVIDSADRERIGEIKGEIERTIGEDDLRDCSLAVLANKQDLASAMTVQEVEEKLDLATIARGKRWNIFPTCATTGYGLYEAMDWLTELYSDTPSRNSQTKSVNTEQKQEENEPAADFEVSLFQKTMAKLKSLLLE